MSFDQTLSSNQSRQTHSHLNVQFAKALKNLSVILKKAEHYAEIKKIDPSVLCQTRLAVDQFPLVRQVQIACDTAKFAVAKLTNKEAPTFEDNEKTLSDLCARISKTVDFLMATKQTDFEGFENQIVTYKWWNGKSLTGSDFVVHYAIPNFYFHFVTSYSILRHCGLEIGKSDYLGELPFK
jgi:hypothetical protein